MTEVQASGTCGRGASSMLRLRQDEAGIEVELEAYDHRAGEVWRVVVVQEGRVVWRTRVRTGGPGGSLSVHHTIGVLRGADRVSARATGSGGLTCVASAVLPG